MLNLKGKYSMKFNLKTFTQKLKIKSNKAIKIPSYYFCVENYWPNLCVFTIYLKDYITTQNKSYTYFNWMR